MPKEELSAQTPSGETACWLCGRTSSEISLALSGDTEDEAKISREIAATKAAREALTSNAAKWREGVPDAFKEFDLAFVLQNADQFKSMQFLGALIEEARNTVRELDEVSYSVRKGAVIRVSGTAVDEAQGPRSLRSSTSSRSGPTGSSSGRRTSTTWSTRGWATSRG